MNKKLLLPLLALAILPVLAIDMGDDADKLGKQFASEYPGATVGVHTLEETLTEKQELDRAELIIEGIVLEAKPYWKVIRDDAKPTIYTEFTVKVDDVIKGENDKDVLKVVLRGGALDGITVQTESPQMIQGSKVILILGKDTDSIFGNAYAPISVSKSIYTIEDSKAVNKLDDRSGNKDMVKQRISDQLK